MRQGRCGAAYFLLVCFLLPPFFFVAVSVLGSVRLGRCLHEVAVVGLRIVGRVSLSVTELAVLSLNVTGRVSL